LILQGKENDEIMQSMEKLQIEESSSNFKRKPVIIIVVGMAGMAILLLSFVILVLWVWWRLA